MSDNETNKQEWADRAIRALHIHNTWGTPDDFEGKTRRMSDYTDLSAAMARALRGEIDA